MLRVADKWNLDILEGYGFTKNEYDTYTIGWNDTEYFVTNDRELTIYHECYDEHSEVLPVETKLLFTLIKAGIIEMVED